ncbi:hypothetical protein QNI22_21790 [Cytophagaceae bacterium BD1B2-1]|uniref:Uncharacterized protein n=1 Tax=Xanthocytophaga agilis TaxID=3048010 RepID=A0AAE3R471_9BACT|nr:hypothetical protein [Xanthocytophaga agilis]
MYSNQQYIISALGICLPVVLWYMFMSIGIQFEQGEILLFFYSLFLVGPILLTIGSIAFVQAIKYKKSKLIGISIVLAGIFWLSYVISIVDELS